MLFDEYDSPLSWKNTRARAERRENMKQAALVAVLALLYLIDCTISYNLY